MSKQSVLAMFDEFVYDNFARDFQKAIVAKVYNLGNINIVCNEKK